MSPIVGCTPDVPPEVITMELNIDDFFKPLTYKVAMSKEDMHFIDPDPQVKVWTAFRISIEDSAEVKNIPEYSNNIEPFNDEITFKMERINDGFETGTTHWALELENVNRDLYSTSILTVTLD